MNPALPVVIIIAVAILSIEFISKIKQFIYDIKSEISGRESEDC